MPLFFFHYNTPTESTRDDVGCVFASLELAYLDAHRSMIEIGAEALKRQLDPAEHRIDIADADGRVLMELHFDEIFRRKPSGADTLAPTRTLRMRLQRCRQLRREMTEACISARQSIEKAHEVLRRARATV